MDSCLDKYFEKTAHTVYYCGQSTKYGYHLTEDSVKKIFRRNPPYNSFLTFLTGKKLHQGKREIKVLTIHRNKSFNNIIIIVAII